MPGSIYGVTITKPGFQTFAVRGLQVNADATVRVDAALELGKLEQTVEVSAQTVTLRADSAEVRSEIGTTHVFTATLVAELPCGRNKRWLSVASAILGRSRSEYGSNLTKTGKG